MLHQYVSGSFPTFDGTGPPEIAAAAPTASEANQSSNNSYREPLLAFNCKPVGDVAAMLVRRLERRRREPDFAHEGEKKARHGAELKKWS